MIRYCLALLMLCALPASAQQEEVIAGLSQTRVSITADFEGSEILIFGAIKRDRPVPPDAEPLEMVIAVAGPSVPVSVRKKERTFGIWINTASVEIDSAPSFYAVATSGPFYKVMSNIEDLRHRVSITRAIRSVGATAVVSNAPDFTAALTRIRNREEIYQLHESTIQIEEETLFRTSIALPANIQEGNYTARMFLTRGGTVIDAYETVIYVQKVGLERFLFALADEQPLLYGLLSLAIAISAGWLASAAFRYLRG